jgi:hypothetical protein
MFAKERIQSKQLRPSDVPVSDEMYNLLRVVVALPKLSDSTPDL